MRGIPTSIGSKKDRGSSSFIQDMCGLERERHGYLTLETPYSLLPRTADLFPTSPAINQSITWRLRTQVLRQARRYHRQKWLAPSPPPLR